MHRKNLLLYLIVIVLVMLTLLVLFRRGLKEREETGPEEPAVLNGRGMPPESGDQPERPADPPAAPESAPAVDPSGYRVVKIEDPSTAGLSGHILDRGRQPVPYMIVEILPTSWLALPLQFLSSQKVRTDQNGFFIYRSLTPGSYQFFCGQVRDTLILRAGEMTIREVVLGGGSSLAGEIVDGQNRPVFPATAYLIAGANRFLAQSNESGRFEIRGIPAGGYQLFGRADGFTPSARQEIRLEENDTAQRATLVLEAGSLLTGYVRNGNGQPQAGVRISTQADPNRYGTLNGISDSSGYFEIDGLPAGQQDLQIWPENSYVRPGPSIRIVPGQDASVEIVLQGSGQINGSVEGPTGKEPLAGVQVNAGIPGTGRDRPRLVCPLDENGRFVMDFLEPGVYSVAVTTPPGSLLTPPPQRVDVGEGEQKSVFFRLDRGAAVTGLVTDPEGQTLAGATVMLRMAGQPGRGNQRRRETDTRGRFEFSSLTAGLYVLEVAATGYQPYRRENIQLQTGSEVDIPVMMQTGGTVMGTVTDASGRPAGQVMVFARAFGDTSFQRLNQTESEPDGRFRLSGLVPGRYVVYAVRRNNSGRGGSPPQNITLDDGNKTVQLNLVLPGISQ